MTNKRRTGITTMIVFGLCLVWAFGVQADVPGLMNYQGQLADEAGICQWE
jgi:hypothetical protein